jgi:membrane-bound metal-dependent hydrolase YbcI (DUF457 family)
MKQNLQNIYGRYGHRIFMGAFFASFLINLFTTWTIKAQTTPADVFVLCFWGFLWIGTLISSKS